jgi:hypothetical protein
VAEGVELAAIVEEVEVEITVVMEEGVVLRRGSLVLAPSEEESTVVLVPPSFGTKFTPTVWRPPRGRTHNYKTRKRPEERGSKEISLIFNSFISRNILKQ